MELKKTLQDYIREAEQGGTEKAFSLLLEFAKNKDNESLQGLIAHFQSLVDGQKSILEAHGKTQELLKQILERPHPLFPEPKDFPESQKVMMDQPAWWQNPNHNELASNIVKGLAPLFMVLFNKLEKEGDANREILEDILDKEPIVLPEAEKAKPPMQLGSIRRHSRWQVVSTKKGTIKGNFDGVNTIFYLPSAPIPNSEQVRLNGGSPLANGEDYSLSSNTITFMVAPIAGSTCEIRYQS